MHYCRKCGTELSLDDVFCRRCGAASGSEASDESPTVSGPKRRWLPSWLSRRVLAAGRGDSKRTQGVRPRRNVAAIVGLSLLGAIALFYGCLYVVASAWMAGRNYVQPAARAAAERESRANVGVGEAGMEGEVGPEDELAAHTSGADQILTPNSPVGTWGFGATSFTFRDDGTMTERSPYGSADGTWEETASERIRVRYTREGTAWEADWQIRDSDRFLHISNRRRLYPPRRLAQLDATYTREGTGDGLVGTWKNGSQTLTFKSDGTVTHKVLTSLGFLNDTGEWQQTGDDLQYKPPPMFGVRWSSAEKGLPVCRVTLSDSERTLRLSDHQYQSPGEAMPDLDLERQ